MKFNEQSLRKKGWNEEEINHAKKIITKHEEDNKNKFNYHKQTTYWLLFVMILAIGIAGSFLIGPFLLFVSPKIAYLLIGTAGLMFGTFAGLVMKDIEDLERHHHVAISIIIPITAIFSSILMSKQVFEAASFLRLNVEIHPIILGAVFSICTLVPYGIFIQIENKKKNESKRLDKTSS